MLHSSSTSLQKYCSPDSGRDLLYGTVVVSRNIERRPRYIGIVPVLLHKAVGLGVPSTTAFDSHKFALALQVQIAVAFERLRVKAGHFFESLALLAGLTFTP